jgi:hypothetical protein
MIIEKWYFYAGMFLFAGAVSAWLKWRARRRDEAPRDEEADSAIATQAGQPSQLAPAVQDEKARREALADLRWDTAVKVHQEWLDFAGLRSRTCSVSDKIDDFASIARYLPVDQRAVLILLYGLGHRAAMTRAAAAASLGRSPRNVRQIERDALLAIESILWSDADRSRRGVVFSKTYKVWLTFEEERLSGWWKRDGEALLTVRQPENPHPEGISDTGDNARQWLEGEAHLVWLRKEQWAAANLPAHQQRRADPARSVEVRA